MLLVQVKRLLIGLSLMMLRSFPNFSCYHATTSRPYMRCPSVRASVRLPVCLSQAYMRTATRLAACVYWSYNVRPILLLRKRIIK